MVSPMTIEPDKRVEHYAERFGERAWRHACALMGNEPDAEDVMQVAFITLARDPERIPADCPWAWFATILTNAARNAWRVRNRARKRFVSASTLSASDQAEDLTMSHEDRSASPSDRAENAEIAAFAKKELALLPEAEREAIVLTVVSGLTHAEAAETLGIPLGTLKSNVRRGMQKLRDKMKVEEGAVAAGLCAMPFAAPAGGLAASLAKWTGIASSTAATAAASAGTSSGAAAAAAQATTSGVARAASTTTAALGPMGRFLLGVTLAGGIGLGFLGGVALDGLGSDSQEEASTTGSSLESTNSREVDARNSSHANEAPLESNPQFVSLQNEVKELRTTIANLEAVKSQQESDMEVLQEQLEAALNRKIGKDLPLSWGEWNDKEELRTVAWDTLGKRLAEYTPVLFEAAPYLVGDESEPMELTLKRQDQLKNFLEEYRNALYRIQRALPSHASKRGAWSHPVFLSNLLNSYFVARGLELGEEQHAKVAALGEAFDKAWKTKQESYGDATLKLEKLVDELILKREFITDVYAALSADQMALLAPEAHRNRHGIDPLSPIVMMRDDWECVWGNDQAHLVKVFIKYASEVTHMRKEELQGASFIFEGWISALKDQLGPVKFFEGKYFTIDEVIKAGQEQLKAIKLFQSLMPVNPALETTLKNLRVIWLPRTGGVTFEIDDDDNISSFRSGPSDDPEEE